MKKGSHFPNQDILIRTLNWKAVVTTQRVFTSSKLTIETLEQGVKYVQS